METVQQNKRALRGEALSRRRGITREGKSAHDLAILKTLLSLPEVQNAASLLAYVSAKENEADTWGMLRAFLAEGRAVFVPVTGRDFGRMDWSRVLSLGELRPARFGLFEPEPADHRLELPPPPAVCLVPGLAFTRAGHRLGYGGGYFDRFLEGFPGCKIGLAYGVQVVESLPVEAHDIPVDLLVTEAGMVDCRTLREN